MDEILNKKVDDIAGMSFDCSCGRRHSVEIEKIVIGRGLSTAVIEAAAKFRGGRILLVSDSNTYRVLGRELEKMLIDEGLDIKCFVFDAAHQLVPDEKAVGRLLIETEKDTSLILTAGSGVLNDLSKLVSYKTGIPYIIAGTAPSMDGYASVVAPIIVGGVKETLDAVYPLAIFGDTGIMKDAPKEMLNAGLGDILGKITALADWNLSRIITDELYCETSAAIIKDALKKCTGNVDGIVSRDAKAVEYVMEGLVLAGVAIGLHGNSRPASGAEHNFAHYWDMDAIAGGREHPLHGNSVAAGTVVTCHIYEMMKQYLPDGFEIPSSEEVIGYLKRTGAPAGPRELGISRELFVRSMHEAYKLKDRYTIFNLVEEKGLLDEITGKLTEKYYD